MDLQNYLWGCIFWKVHFVERYKVQPCRADREFWFLQLENGKPGYFSNIFHLNRWTASGWGVVLPAETQREAKRMLWVREEEGQVGSWNESCIQSVSKYPQILSTSSFFPGHLSRGWGCSGEGKRECCSHSSFFTSEEAVPVLSLLPFPFCCLAILRPAVIYSGSPQRIIKSSFCLEIVAWEGACEPLNVLIRVCSWDCRSVRNLHMEIPSPFPLLINTALESEALAFKASFRNFYSLLLAFYCKNNNYQELGRQSHAEQVLGLSEEAQHWSSSPPLLAEQDTGPS